MSERYAVVSWLPAAMLDDPPAVSAWALHALESSSGRDVVEVFPPTELRDAVDEDHEGMRALGYRLVRVEGRVS